MHVLCVDDDRVNGLLLEQALLQFDGLTLAFAESGAEALVQARDRVPDLLVLDLHLPDTDGLSLLPQLRSVTDVHDLPAVLCTAEAAQDVAAQAEVAGFRQVWTKPVTADQIRSVLGLGRSPSTGGDD